MNLSSQYKMVLKIYNSGIETTQIMAPEVLEKSNLKNILALKNSALWVWNFLNNVAEKNLKDLENNI